MKTTPPSRRNSWIGALARYRWLLLIAAAVYTAVLWWPASQLKLEESIESFYAPDDPYLVQYLRSKSLFGGDEFVIVGYEADDPTSEDELRRIKEFSAKLSTVPGIQAESTQDLSATLRNPRASGLVRVALRLPTTERGLLNLSRRVLIGDDKIGDGKRTVAIILRLEDKAEAGVSRTETYTEIRALANAHQPRAFVVGEPLQVHDMFRYVEQDSWVLGLASSALLMLVILAFFRSLRWVLLPIVVIQITLLWTRGLLYVSGMQLSMVSSIMTALVTIIVIQTVMHVTESFREYRMTMPRVEAFQETVARLAVPIFWITFTTAIGFGSLIFTSITPVRSFGIMMTLSTMLMLAVCLLVLPGGILIGRMHMDPNSPFGEQALGRRLEQLARWSMRHPWLLLLLTVLLAVSSGWGMTRLKIETDFSKNFRESSPIVQSLEFFEAKLGGVGTWEVSFDVPHNLAEVDLDRVRQLADELRQVQLPDGTKLTKVVALTDGLDLVPKVPIDNEDRPGGLLSIFRTRTPTLEERQEILRDLQPEMESSLYNAEAGRMRILLRALERQPAEVKLRLIDEVEKTAHNSFPEAKATGMYVLLAYLISNLFGDQLISFSLATIGVWISMVIVTRSWWTGLISIIPNILPNLLVIGGMGWAGMPINIGTAMIAAVSIGLTVDTTIFYLAVYERSLASGASHIEAIQYAHGNGGLTLVLSTVALVVGFSALALSNFVPLVYFGVLVSVSMVGGLICNLLLLPVLLRDRQKPARGT